MTNYRTAKNVQFIWHGEWSDPELEFDGHVIDLWSIEDFICSCMKDEGLNYNDDDLFDKWIEEHQELIEQTIIEFADAYNKKTN